MLYEPTLTPYHRELIERQRERACRLRAGAIANLSAKPRVQSASKAVPTTKPARDFAAEFDRTEDLFPGHPGVDVESIFTTIKRMVAAEFNLTKKIMDSRCRKTAMVMPRQVVMFLAREMTKLSTPQIGERLGGRDHSTVINGIHKTADRMIQDPSFRHRIEVLRARILEQIQKTPAG